MIGSASVMTWRRPSVRYSIWKSAQTRIGGSSCMEAIALWMQDHVSASAAPRNGEVADLPAEASSTPGLSQSPSGRMIT